jgi:hypothetical protein
VLYSPYGQLPSVASFLVTDSCTSTKTNTKTNTTVMRENKYYSFEREGKT